MNIIEDWTLERILHYLDSNSTSGWPKDADVGELIATYTIGTHPEYFI